MLLLLFVVPLGASAQAPESPPGQQRKLLLYVDQQPGGGLTENQLLMLSRSLLVSLQAGVSGLAVSDAGGIVLQAPASGLSDLAQKSGADFWLWVQDAADAGNTHLRIRGFDVLTQELKLDKTVNRDGELSPLDLPYEKWDDVVSLVTTSLPAEVRGAPDAPGPREVTLTVRALPGTVITGTGGKNVRAGQDGFASLNLSAPGEYSLRATHPGYYPETSHFYLADDKEVVLQQAPASRWAIDASLLQMGYPSVDVARFILPNSFYVKLGITTYAVGLALAGNQVVSNNPLTNFVFQTGIYLRPEDVLFRAYVNLGAFVRFVYAPGTLVGVDPLSWGGIQLSLGTEIGSSPRGRFFFEFQPMMYAVSVPGLFQASFGTNGPPPGWSFSANSALDILCFRVGYRWTF